MAVRCYTTYLHHEIENVPKAADTHAGAAELWDEFMQLPDHSGVVVRIVTSDSQHL